MMDDGIRVESPVFVQCKQEVIKKEVDQDQFDSNSFSRIHDEQGCNNSAGGKNIFYQAEKDTFRKKIVIKKEPKEEIFYQETGTSYRNDVPSENIGFQHPICATHLSEGSEAIDSTQDSSDGNLVEKVPVPPVSSDGSQEGIQESRQNTCELVKSTAKGSSGHVGTRNIPTDKDSEDTVGTKTYACPVCNKRFSKRYHLKEHKYMVHSREKSFQCSQCKERFVRLRDLTYHIKISHRSIYKSVCPCGELFTSEKELDCHKKTCNRTEFKQCGQCENHIPTGIELPKVLTECYAGRPYCFGFVKIVPLTDEPLKSQRLSSEHLEENESSSIVMEQSQSASEERNKDMSNERPHICSSIGFKTSGDQRKRISTRKKTHECDKCNKTFICFSHLKKHMYNTHTGEKPYACSKCPRGFTRERELKKHLIQYHQDAVDQIFDCQQSYNRKRELLSHSLTHQGVGLDRVFKHASKISAKSKSITQKQPIIESGNQLNATDQGQMNCKDDRKHHEIDHRQTAIDHKLSTNTDHYQDSSTGYEEVGSVLEGLSDLEPTLSELGEKPDMCSENTLERLAESEPTREIPESSIGNKENQGIEQSYAEGSVSFTQEGIEMNRLIQNLGVRSEIVEEEQPCKKPEVYESEVLQGLGKCSGVIMVHEGDTRTDQIIQIKESERIQESDATELNTFDQEASTDLSQEENERQPKENLEITVEIEASKPNNSVTSNFTASSFIATDTEKDTDNRRDNLSLTSSINSCNLEEAKPRPYSCLKCGKRYLTKKYLAQHMKIHNKRKQFVCSECPARFYQRSAFIYHLKQNHCDIFIHVCECGERFHSEEELTIHKGTHVGDKPMKCLKCKKKFTREDSYVHHMRKHMEKQYKCCQCEQSFSFRSELIVHFSTHNLKRNHSCPKCTQKIDLTGDCVENTKTHLHESSNDHSVSQELKKNTSNVRPHISIHTSQKMHECHICHKKVTCLKRHLQTHTGEKPYACDKCSKKFRCLSHLKEHMYTHTGKKPFACSKCPRGFTRESELKKHLIQYHQDAVNQISDCQKSYIGKRGLLSHSLTHQGVGLDLVSKHAKKISVKSKGITQKQPLIESGNQLNATDQGQMNCKDDRKHHEIDHRQTAIDHKLSTNTDHYQDSSTGYEEVGSVVEGLSDIEPTLCESEERPDMCSEKTLMRLPKSEPTREIPESSIGNKENQGIEESYAEGSDSFTQEGMEMNQLIENLCVRSEIVEEEQPCKKPEACESEVLQGLGKCTGVIMVREVDTRTDQIIQIKESERIQESDATELNTFDQETSADIPQENNERQPKENLVIHDKLHGLKKGIGKGISHVGSECGKTCKILGDLQKHFVTHTCEKRYACDVCGKKFRCLHHVKEHVLTHTTEKPFVCPRCPRTFAVKRYLTKHFLRHKKIDINQESNNGNKFSYETEVYMQPHEHEKNFDDEKLHLCHQCGKRFKKKCHLKEHMFTHTGKRPFACSQCPRSFRRKKELMDHIEYHGVAIDQGPECRNNSSSKSKGQTHKQSDIEPTLCESQEKADMCSEKKLVRLPKSEPTREIPESSNGNKENQGIEQSDVEESVSFTQEGKEMNQLIENLCVRSEIVEEEQPCNKPEVCESEVLQGLGKRTGVIMVHEVDTRTDQIIQIKESERIQKSDATELNTFDQEASVGLSQEEYERQPKENLEITVGIEASKPNDSVTSNDIPSSFIATETTKDADNRRDNLSLTSSINSCNLEEAKPRPYSCLKCGKRYLTKKYLAQHMKMHNKRKQFVCSECQARFYQRSAFIYHLKQNHCDIFIHVCECGERFHSEEELTIHKGTHVGDKPMKCLKCKRKFTREDSYVHHMRKHMEKRYKCCQCEQSFAFRRELIVHFSTHNLERSHSCPICTQKIDLTRDCVKNTETHLHESSNDHSISQELKKNMSDVRPHTSKKMHECHICHKKVRCLKKHLQTHTGGKPYECDNCSKKFRCLRYLKEHMYMHGGERPFVCSICQQSFARKRNLVKHSVKHHRVGLDHVSTGDNENKFSSVTKVSTQPYEHDKSLYDEKPHLCHQCGKRFKKKCNFKEHMFTHTGKRPFACSQCPRSFSRRKQLRDHIEYHQVAIEQGPKRLRCRERYLVQHTLECSLCTKSFGRMSGLVMHSLVCHWDGIDETREKGLKSSLQSKVMSQEQHHVTRQNHSHEITKRQSNGATDDQPLDPGKDHMNNKEQEEMNCKAPKKSDLSSRGQTWDTDQGLCLDQEHDTSQHPLLHTKDKQPDNDTVCDCGERFQTKGDLTFHKVTCHGKMLECPLCKKAFKEKRSYIHHLIIHMEKHHKCPRCEETFRWSFQVSAHMETHLRGSKDMKTGIVTEGSTEATESSTPSSKSELCKDGRQGPVWLGHACSHCDKWFRNPLCLKGHMYVHTGEKFFRCTVCTLSFVNRKLLLYHSAAHHGVVLDQICECGKGFASKAEVIAHIATHDTSNVQSHGLGSHHQTHGIAHDQESCNVEELSKMVDNCNSTLSPVEKHPICEEPQLRNARSEKNTMVSTAKSCIGPERRDGGSKSLEFNTDDILRSLEAGDSQSGSSQPSNSTLGDLQEDESHSDQHQCPECDQFFSKPRLLHIKTHNTNLHKCLKCGQHFNTPDIIKKHLEQHCDKTLKCLICEKSFPRKEYLMKHVKEHFIKPYKCTECEKSFFDRTNLNRHLRIMHRKKKHLEQHCDKTFKCLICEKSFPRKEFLVKHVKEHFSKPYKCTECEKSFFESTNLDHHFRFMHQKNMEKAYLCSICGITCTSKACLMIHEEGHKRKKLNTCPDCGHSVASKRLLTKHIYACRGGKPFKCSVCQELFGDKYEFNRHMKWHAGHNQCPVCKRQFKKSSHLSLHILMAHEKERPFQCPQCPSRFFTKGSLNKHLRYHTGERSFKCPLCDKAFICGNGRNRHLEKVHKEEKSKMCNKCGKRFASREELISHRKRVNGKRPYWCATCAEKFQTMCDLTVHLKTHSN